MARVPELSGLLDGPPSKVPLLVQIALDHPERVR
jgi:hypothetical protein